KRVCRQPAEGPGRRSVGSPRSRRAGASRPCADWHHPRHSGRRQGSSGGPSQWMSVHLNWRRSVKRPNAQQRSRRVYGTRATAALTVWNAVPIFQWLGSWLCRVCSSVLIASNCRRCAMCKRTPLKSICDAQRHQLGQPAEVGLHVLFAAGGCGAVVVQKYVVQAVAVLYVELCREPGRHSLEFHADWVLLIVDPAFTHEADRLVVAVEHYIAAIFLALQAVGEVRVAQFILQHCYHSSEVLH